MPASSTSRISADRGLDADQPLHRPVHVSQALGDHHRTVVVYSGTARHPPGRAAGHCVDLERCRRAPSPGRGWSVGQLGQRLALGRRGRNSAVRAWPSASLTCTKNTLGSGRVGPGPSPGPRPGQRAGWQGPARPPLQLFVDPVDQVPTHQRRRQHTGGDKGGATNASRARTMVTRSGYRSVKRRWFSCISRGRAGCAARSRPRGRCGAASGRRCRPYGAGTRCTTRPRRRHRRVVVPDRGKDLALGHHPFGVLQQAAQQLELGQRQLDRLAGLEDLVAVLVQLEVRILQYRSIRARPARGGRTGAAARGPGRRARPG